MDSLTVTVPPEQQSDVASWQDGETYTITVKQKAPGQFDLVSVEAESPQEDGAEGGEEGGAMGGDEKNPAVAVVIAAKKKGA